MNQHFQAALRFGAVGLLSLLCLATPHPGRGQEPNVPYRLPPPTGVSPDYAPLPPQYPVAPPAEPLTNAPLYQPAPTEQWVHATPVEWPVEASLQMGINGSEGNAQAFSMRAGGDFTYEFDANVWKADFTYAKTSTRSILTQHNALFNAKYEHLFESPWTLFARFGTEWDEFKAFDLRVFLNAGLGYRLLDTDTTKLKGRFGAGWSREINGPHDRYVPEGVLGVDFEQRLSDRHKFTLTSDYFPSWEDFSDYRLVNNVGWELLLDEVSRLSLKVSVIDRYDSTPEGRKPNDLDYAILLMWKL
jgi:putative salt-induced outer membrane protein YdiY